MKIMKTKAFQMTVMNAKKQKEVRRPGGRAAGRVPNLRAWCPGFNLQHRTRTIKM